jgi:transposase-like protein
MEAFPKTQAEFQRVFRRESACRRFLLGCRWPGGFQCSSCECRRHWINNRLVLVCAGCRREYSLTAGTVLHKSRKPLTLWFQAMWWVVTQKTGGSAKGLQRLMGFGSYQTAWAWLHKLRRAMVRSGREKLSGTVEVDEAWVGGSEKGPVTNRKTSKAEVVVAVEVQGAGIGRARIQVVPDSTTRSLMNFVQENIEPGSRIVTDGWSGYAQLEARGYRHSSYTLYGVAARAAKALPRVHRVISLAKRWLLGTHQGRCTRRHMQAYMDEFVFRFNRRKSRHVGNLFRRILEQVGHSTPVTFRQLTTSGRIRRHNA